MDYLQFLERLHWEVHPDVYLEIGVHAGNSLAISRSRTIAIEPDPIPNPSALMGKPWVKFYRATSDDFFRIHSREATLEGRKLDLAFIDGLHEFAQVVRDFQNIERWGHQGTVVVIHDVLPQLVSQASRAWHEGDWTGDVWRIVRFLSEHRPDLSCTLVNTPPTGVLLVTNLDPTHPGMAKAAEALDLNFVDDGPEYDDLVSQWIAEARPLGVEAAIRAALPNSMQ